MEKLFQQWHTLKCALHGRDNAPVVKQREVWWCSVGANVGHETDGKGIKYSRPVLVVRKFNKHIFLGVPLTTQIKQKPYYFQIHFQGRDQCVVLSQLRLWDSKRLTSRMGSLPKKQFEELRVAIRAMI